MIFILYSVMSSHMYQKRARADFSSDGGSRGESDSLNRFQAPTTNRGDRRRSVKRYCCRSMFRCKRFCCCLCAFFHRFLMRRLLDDLPRRSYVFIFYAFFLGLIIVCFLFSLVIYYICKRALVEHDELCIDTKIERNGEDASVLPFTFADCFNLALQTFTTVGYGYISPMSSRPGSFSMCLLVNLALVMLAFFGIMFASTSAGVIFMKLQYYNTIPSVEFSDFLLLNYCGSEGADDNDNDNDNDGDVVRQIPRMEFRIVNTSLSKYSSITIEVSTILTDEVPSRLSSTTFLRR